MKITSNKHGFTIVELLVVIVVIGILAAITIVSYAGITNRATIASIQSDLTSASTLLKMDQITTESFPTTLALANSGKGITPSQTMDSVIYIPDNTSNPKTFCLQYKKGTNTYAVDNSSVPSSGVCLQNLVGNGDFSGGATVWAHYDSAFTTANNIATITGNGGQPSTSLIQTKTGGEITGHKVYARITFMTTNSVCNKIYMRIQGSANSEYADATINTPSQNQWYTKSAILASTGNGNLNVGISETYTDAATANGKVMEVQYVSAIDLTIAFGVGNEPTQAQMDTIMSSYPNSWFNVVAKASL